jgi:Eco29kI restriction endonuclease
MSAYDPASTHNLSRDVVRELLAQPFGPMPPAQRFVGAGIYALYYAGSDPVYAAVSDPKCRKGPIYVGKSRPAKNEKDAPLYSRLRDHATSIGQAPNLNVAEFRCRYLILVPAWIRPSEDFLEDYYQPLWNKVLKGFGNRAVGGTRTGQQASLWDTLHGGRAGAATAAQRRNRQDIVKAVAAHLAAHPPRTKSP